MRLLDEATATAIGSGSADFACVGQTCCTMLAACELTGDIERASEWCEHTTEYARRYRFRTLFAQHLFVTYCSTVPTGIDTAGLP